MKSLKQFPVLLTMVFVVCLTLAHAQARLVEEVEFRGNRSVSVVELRRHVKTKAGERYHQAQVKRDLAQLLVLEIFDKLQSKVVIQDGPRGGAVVCFVLQERSNSSKQ